MNPKHKHLIRFYKTLDTHTRTLDRWITATTDNIFKNIITSKLNAMIRYRSMLREILSDMRITVKSPSNIRLLAERGYAKLSLLLDHSTEKLTDTLINIDVLEILAIERYLYRFDDTPAAMLLRQLKGYYEQTIRSLNERSFSSADTRTIGQYYQAQ